MSALTAGTLLEGRYELECLLGRGGMASVYRARDRRLGRLVAVKVLNADRQDAAGAAFREDQVTARLAHPNIVGIYDSGATPDGRPFLVMELIEGRPADERAPLPVERALAVAEEVAAAVAHAHAQGIVHCDLKPQNVLLDAFGRARLTDFGVASADRAPVGEIVYGSASYIAPERLRGAPTSPAVDIYALGALLYFLIAGRPPYAGTSPQEIIAQLQTGPPPPLASLAPTVPPAVDAIVRRAMAPDPAERFPSAAALRDAVAEARRVAGDRTRVFSVAPTPHSLTGTMALPRAPAAPPEPVAPPPAARAPAAAPRRPSWLLPLLAGCLLALLLAGVAGGVWWFVGGPGRAAAPVEAPAVAGLTLEEAYGQLRERGLRVGQVFVVVLPDRPGNVVVYQSVPPHSPVRPATAVDLVIAAP